MDRLRNPHRPVEGGSEDESNGALPVDWRQYKFFSIDSPQTIQFEDAIHLSTCDQTGVADSWHLDLKVVHPTS